MKLLRDTQKHISTRHQGNFITANKIIRKETVKKNRKQKTFISKVFDFIKHLFGFYDIITTDGCIKNYTNQFANKRKKNRVRNKMAKLSRRINRGIK